MIGVGDVYECYGMEIRVLEVYKTRVFAEFYNLNNCLKKCYFPIADLGNRTSEGTGRRPDWWDDPSGLYDRDGC